MRINHELIEKLQKTTNFVKKDRRSIKTRAFDKLEEMFGLGNIIRTKDLYNNITGGTLYGKGSFPWHIYGHYAFLTIPGNDGRYLKKVGRGKWVLIDTL